MTSYGTRNTGGGVFRSPDGELQAVINGGEPLDSCPSREEAEEWVEKANEDKETDIHEPNWKLDCGLKLDFDGPVMDVSSRFYPPKSHYGDKWDGDVMVMVMGEEVARKELEADSLDELKQKVEEYVSGLADCISLPK